MKKCSGQALPVRAQAMLAEAWKGNRARGNRGDKNSLRTGGCRLKKDLKAL